MSNKIVVPEGMRNAFHHAENHGGLKWDDYILDKMLEAALRWLAENPILPTEKQVDALAEHFNSSGERSGSFAWWLAVEWQRHQFLAPEPDGRSEIADLISDQLLGCVDQENRLLEAYRRGQSSK